MWIEAHTHSGRARKGRARGTTAGTGAGHRCIVGHKIGRGRGRGRRSGGRGGVSLGRLAREHRAGKKARHVRESHGKARLVECRHAGADEHRLILARAARALADEGQAEAQKRVEPSIVPTGIPSTPRR